MFQSPNEFSLLLILFFYGWVYFFNSENVLFDLLEIKKGNVIYLIVGWEIKVYDTVYLESDRWGYSLDSLTGLQQISLSKA